MPSPTRKKGDIGESIVEMFLVKQGWCIIERNYLRKWGEIDIVAEKGDIIHFIEVKSSISNFLNPENDVSYETMDVIYTKNPPFFYRPEENMTFGKMKRFERSIRSYHMEHSELEDREFVIDVYCVLLDFLSNKAIIYSIDNVNLG
ncbi:MAG: hypothetical protein COU90_03685 [Candidatus Ryanbacteria bacterium CG10_big_fil_rev_8_21_14_0_10_43_42]|uniref:UPF0102 protein COU90_03685 n=1 Tax=Candidatus Ryanbacteria bacterium CG10_big_fil_rev_8_21_14_0_10_43_42 TaxID=1974864 RepID=A0A2M8KW62_9BACT|nr:MAG: hypothetical protein COU90_03685 [Candidatus Ryanbacteria bacterium CG10_big_fil_rev_8_21_14_0_10_43_42]